MKAAMVTGPNALEIWDVPMPTPGPYEALCKLLYGATCTGTDSHIVENNFPFLSPLPTILGHESVGEVVEVGAKVRHFRPGDIVTRVGAPAGDGYSITWGGFAEYGLACDHWAMCADGIAPSEWRGKRVNQVVPTGVDPAVAPMFTTWRETRSFLVRMPLSSGFRILVIGSGGNGFSFAVHARILGAARVSMVGSPGRSDLASRAGIDDYLDYRSEDGVEALKDSGATEVDLILDAVGRTGAVDAYLPLLADGGLVAIYGIDDYRAVTLNPAFARGGFAYWNGGYDEAETHGAVSDAYRAGLLDASIWYDPGQSVPLADIASAFAALHRREGGLKALIRLG